MSWDLFSAAEQARRDAAREAPPEPATAAEPASSGQAYTVSAVNALAREVLEGAFPPLWVSGEVSGWKRYGSGHCYFALRDAEAQIRCVMFRSDAARLPTDPEHGMEARVLGTLTLYEKRGEYQLVARELETREAGGLYRLAFERLRAKLDAEGLLAPERKRAIPRYPAVVGVVTSASGAALHDILHVIRRRAPWTRVVLSPAAVQGTGAAADVARAVRLFARREDVDVLIVGRGGGSAEDLWAFNEEAVARAIADSPIPVISAVGHEVDVTIADLVADERAPTPSAAAERAVPDGAALARGLDAAETRLRAGVGRLMRRRRDDLAWLEETLASCARGAVDARRDRLARAAEKLEVLSPLASLRRGYSVAQAEDGRVLRRAADFSEGLPFRLRVADGRIAARVEAVQEDA